MTSTRRSALAALTVLAAATVAPAQQKPSRLLVVNRTGTNVELFVRVRNEWHSRGRISPGASLPVLNVTNGQQFRAAWASMSKTHTVTLRFDRAYGGWQDTLSLP